MEAYNQAAIAYEHVIEKYCRLLGTSYAALIAHDDRIALRALRSMGEVDEQRIGCIGLSGGGGRAAMLRACSKSVRATVIVGMMSGYEHLLAEHVRPHSWLFFPDNLPAACDWPDLDRLRGERCDRLAGAIRSKTTSCFPAKGCGPTDAKLRSRAYEAMVFRRITAGAYCRTPKFDRAMQGVRSYWLALSCSPRPFAVPFTPPSS